MEPKQKDMPMMYSTVHHTYLFVVPCQMHCNIQQIQKNQDLISKSIKQEKPSQTKYFQVSTLYTILQILIYYIEYAHVLLKIYKKTIKKNKYKTMKINTPDIQCLQITYLISKASNDNTVLKYQTMVFLDFLNIEIS